MVKRFSDYQKRAALWCAVVVLALLLLFPGSICAQSEFTTADKFIEDVVIEQLPIATTFAFAPDNKIFIALKDGVVRVVEDGSLLSTPFVDISSETNRNTDRGLLGLAIDPDFPTRPFVYLLYVYDPPGMTADTAEPRVIRLVRVVADANKGYNVALPESTQVILGKNSLPQWIAAPFDKNSGIIPEPASCMSGLNIDGTPVEDCLPADAKSHSAGTLMFGRDRSLYVSLGDGSNYDGANRPALRAQMLDSLAGKVLRIDPNTGHGLSGNPFYDAGRPASNRSRVWAYGLRNPFRITLNPATGQVYSGDVGSSSWEEVNAGKGANFGWPCYEGGVSPLSDALESGDTVSLQNSSYGSFSRTRDLCRQLYQQGEGAVRSPLFSYAHIYVDGKDSGGSTTGVAFYSGRAYPPRYRGSLFIADYALRWLRFLTFDELGKASVNDFAKEVGSGLGIVDLHSGPDTNVYALYLDLKSRRSQLRRFRFLGDSNTPPRVLLSASPDAGSIPLAVAFRSDGTFDPDGQELSYRWDFGDGASSVERHPMHLFQKVGTFEVKLTVTEASTPFASSSKRITIRTGVTPPKARIDLPVIGSTFTVGDTIRFAGRALFEGQSSSPEATLSWAVIQHHNDHTHLEKEISGPEGAFVAEEHADNSWYEVCLAVSAGEGLEDQSCREIFPQRSQRTFTSEPTGAKITYVEEQTEVLAPHTVNPIVGSRRTIIAERLHADRSFIGWSDGVLDAQRSFLVDSASAEYRALYDNLSPMAAIRASSPIQANRTVRFDGTASSDPERALLRYYWDLGDGQTAEGSVIEHSYARPGVYRVVLVVEDKLGKQGRSELSISVEGPDSNPGTPTPQPTASPKPTNGDVKPRGTPHPSSVLPRLGLSVRTLDRIPCQGLARACRLTRNGSLQVEGRVDRRSRRIKGGLTLTLKLKSMVSNEVLSVVLSLPQRRTKFSRRISGATFSRHGTYRLTLEYTDPQYGRTTRSRSSFVVVRRSS